MTSPGPLRVLDLTDLGPIPWDTGLVVQERLRDARIDGERPDTLVLLEHQPVYTLGRATDPDHLTADKEWRRARGITVRETDRGGDITYHGPGMLVGYPVFHLDVTGRDVHRHLRLLEQALIALLARWGVTGGRRDGRTGVWVRRAGADGDVDEKIAALGVHVRRWVTTHGFALNVDPDLEHFAGIVPCGLRDWGVTSLAACMSESAVTPVPTLGDAALAAAEEVADAFGHAVLQGEQPGRLAADLGVDLPEPAP